MTVRKLHEEICAVKTTMRSMVDDIGDGAWTPEQNEKWDRLDQQAKVLTRQLQAQQRLNELDELPAPNQLKIKKVEDSTTLSDLPAEQRLLYRDNALRAWIRTQAGLASPNEWLEAARVCRMDVNVRDWSPGLPQRIQRTGSDLDIGTAALGQETVPEDFSAAIYAEMEFSSPVTQVARVVRTMGGNTLDWPVASDIANDAAIAAEEAIGTFAAPDFDQIQFGAYKYATSIKMSTELTEDTGINLTQFLTEQLGGRMGRGMNAHFTTGTGSGQPTGFVTDALNNTASGGAAAKTTYSITAGALGATSATNAYVHMVDLVHLLDPSYRRRNAAIMCHDLIFAEIRKGRDSQGTPVWQPSMIVGDPDRILGYPVVVNQDMDSTEANLNEVAAFGDWSAYVVRMAGAFRVRVLRERYADTDQVAILMFQRADGATLTQIDWTKPPIVLLQALT